MDVDGRVDRAASCAVNRVLTAIAVAAAVLFAVPAVASAAIPASVQPVPGTLLGVNGSSAADVWAVGTTPGSTLPAGTLTEHWNGVRWRVVPSLSPGTGKGRDNVLYGVAAVSRADVWAVGSYSSGPDALTATTFGLIEHWNGTRWSRVPCPCSHSENGVPSLAGIAAVSRSDIWAVGSGVGRPLIVHWNGKKWVRQFLAGNGEDELTAVSATSARNAWAVGIDIANDRSLTAHWNGKKWSYVRNPNPGHFNVLRGVTAISRTEAWAVGQNTVKNVKIVRWNGSMWSLVPEPHIAGELQVFNAIAAARGALWAVGKRTTSNSLHIDRTLTARWTGTRWIAVPSPSFGSADNTLYGVYAPSARSAWAVGGAVDLGVLIEHWNGRTWHLITP